MREVHEDPPRRGLTRGSDAANGDVFGKAQARLGDIARVARRHFSCPTALVSTSVRLLMRDLGVEVAGPVLDGIDGSFAAHVIDAGEAMVVLDARADPRFENDFLVVAYPFIRFYAGAPIRLARGGLAGVVSLIDYAPRPAFGAEEVAVLSALANLAAGEIERALLETARVREAAQVRAMAMRSDLAVLEVDGQGLIAHWNDAARQMLGATDEGLKGAPMTRHVLQGEALTHRCRLALCTGAAVEETRMPVDLLAADGRVVPVEAMCASWMEDGEIRHRLVLEPAD